MMIRDHLVSLGPVFSWCRRCMALLQLQPWRKVLAVAVTSILCFAKLAASVVVVLIHIASRLLCRFIICILNNNLIGQKKKSQRPAISRSHIIITWKSVNEYQLGDITLHLHVFIQQTLLHNYKKKALQSAQVTDKKKKIAPTGTKKS